MCRHFTEAEVNEIKKTTFKDVIMEVTEIKSNELQDDVFFVTNGKNTANDGKCTHNISLFGHHEIQ
jgi:hypothetical protein